MVIIIEISQTVSTIAKKWTQKILMLKLQKAKNIKETKDSKPMCDYIVENIRERYVTLKRIIHSYSHWNLPNSFKYCKKIT